MNTRRTRCRAPTPQAAPAAIRRRGRCTGRCGASCGRTARSTSRRWPSPPSCCSASSISTIAPAAPDARAVGARPGAAARRDRACRTAWSPALIMVDRVHRRRSFYCLDALHGERRDRSILFWKSLPVSDLTTVLAKASIPLLVLPLLAFALTVGHAADHAAAEQRGPRGSGMSAATLWTQLPFFQDVAGHCSTALWPCTRSGMRRSTAGCCWSRPGRGARHFSGPCCRRSRSAVVEKIAFNTSYFAAMVQYRLIGGPEPDAPARQDDDGYAGTPVLWGNS